MKIRIGKTTDYFLSSYTVEGYRSFFDQALHNTVHLVTLSGASAQIRSRICRQIGIALIDRGYNVELIHGISNTCDLEGIMVPQLALMMADQEKVASYIQQNLPQLEVTQFNLNQFVWEDKYPIYEAKIKDLREQIAVNIDLVYEYLHQAKRELISYDGGLLFSEQQSSSVVERLAKMLFFKEYGKTNHRFGQSLTGEGQVNYYKGILKNTRKKYFLNGVNYRSSCKVLEGLAHEANKAGLVVDAYHDFLEAELMELIIIPELEVAVSAKALSDEFEELLTYKDTACQPALAKCIDPNLNDNLTKINDVLSEIKQLSSTVGELYQGVIDFAAIEQLEKQLLDKILQMVKPDNLDHPTQ